MKKNRTKRICKFCNNEFEICPCFIKNGGGSYCSMECRNEAMKGRKLSKETKIKMSEAHKQIWKNKPYRAREEKIKVVCGYSECNKIFETPIKRLKQGRGKFCSRRCLVLDTASRRDSKIDVECLLCQKNMRIWPYQLNEDEKYFCSKICSNKFNAKCGEDNHLWRGGISFEPYSQDWTNDLRDVIRKRDSFICQECGIHQEELCGMFKKLDVHHIDYDKKNCNPDNLITLCRSCHAKTNVNRDYWLNYFNK